MLTDTPPNPSAPSTQSDPYADWATIKSLVQRKKDEWSKGREPFVRAAYRNILFYQGIQWIKFDRSTSRWRPARLPRTTPTPVTNIFASTMDALISVFARIEPQLNFRPGTPEEPADRATADVSIRAIQVIEDEVNIRFNRQILATEVGLGGMAWLETGYDPDPIHGTKFLQHDQCSQCGNTQPPGQSMCSECGGGPLQPAMDDMGQPVGEQVPIGKLFVDVVSIFEMWFDPSITDWRKQRAFLREKGVSLDESKARWPHIKDQIKPNVMSDSDGWYGEALPVTGPQLDESQTARMLATTRQSNTHVTERWYWQLPDDTYPDGLLAVIVGEGNVAYAGPLPYASQGADGVSRPFLPFVVFPQKLVPRSGYAKTVANDLALKQSQRNRWESIIEACGMRMGSPVWLKPNGANVTGLTGDPGNIISYNAVGPNAAKPEQLGGKGFPLAFIEMIDRIDKNFEELAATFDVVKGSRPEGVSAGIALQILQERGMSRYGPLFILWEQAWAEWARQALEIFREFATEPRLLKIKGRDGEWQVTKFLGADIQGRIDVMPEAASSMPRSTLLDRAEVEQLIAIGALPPPAMNPELQYKVLDLYGRTNFLPTMANDTKNAIRENEAFRELAQSPILANATPENIQTLQMSDPMIARNLIEQEGQVRGVPVKLPKVRAAIDDHSVHIREHRADAKSESFQNLPEIVQTLMEKHIEEHQMLAMQQAQALQAGPSMPLTGGMGGGLNSKPPARQQEMNTSSGGGRLAGEHNEMAGEVAAGGM